MLMVGGAPDRENVDKSERTRSYLRKEFLRMASRLGKLM